jgi:molecular chaperone HscB
MPASFLMQQMAWREALEEAGSADQVEALDLEVGRQEKALQAELARHLDESLDLEAAVGAVRSLMFLGRFRADIQRRMEALES